jgi:carbon-monoxide dehydrogenase small subunit
MVYRLKGPLAQFGRPALVAEVADGILRQTADAMAARASGDATAQPEQNKLGGAALIGRVLRGLLKRILWRS